MLFEVKKDGVVKMFTTNKKCVPDKDTLKKMKAAGYKFWLNGKIYKDS